MLVVFGIKSSFLSFLLSFLSLSRPVSHRLSAQTATTDNNNNNNNNNNQVGVTKGSNVNFSFFLHVVYTFCGAVMRLHARVGKFIIYLFLF